MKTITVLFCLLFTMQLHSQSYNIDKYKRNVYPSVFGITEFKDENSLKDFKRLRMFYREKSDLLNTLKEGIKETEDNQGLLDLLEKDKAKFEKLILNKKPEDDVFVDVNLISKFDYGARQLGLSSVKKPVSELQGMLEQINTKIDEVSTSTIAYKNIMGNIINLQDDIDKCNSQIDSTLAPEYQQQNFRIWISICFTVLIAILLIMFFLIVYLKSDNTLSKELLSGNGLQFITLFVLIIAIILFGILNILQGTELATILSGISGYILGKGVNVMIPKATTVDNQHSETKLPIS